MKEEPLTATSEFWVSFTGPLFSLLLALLFRTGMLLSLRYPDAAILYSSFTYLFLVNLLLGILNLLPGFPMDGGRVLKGVLWGLTGNRNRAARVSVSTGMGLAWLFMAAGLAIILMGLWLGAWLVLAGIFQAKAILPYAGSESRSWPGA